MRSPIDRLMGDLSYPIYVAHWLVISFVGHFNGFFYGYVSYDYYREGDIVFVILAAAILHFAFERSIDYFRQRVSSAPKLGMSAPSVPYRDAEARATVAAE